jgi:hypothetical protein
MEKTAMKSLGTVHITCWIINSSLALVLGHSGEVPPIANLLLSPVSPCIPFFSIAYT